MSNFRVGQKVVCVDISNVHPNIHPNGVPSVGEVCTVAEIIPDGVAVKEYPVICCAWGIPIGFKDYRFRPLIEDLTAELARNEAERIVTERPERINEPEPIEQ